MIYVDIASACNKKWITNGKDGVKGLENIALNERYLTDGRLEGNGYSFAPPETGNDLMSCMGQRIALPAQSRAKELWLASITAFGMHFETVTTEYESGEIDAAKFMFIDMLWQENEYLFTFWIDLRTRNICGEKALEFTCERDGETVHGAIRVQRIPLRKRDKPLAITLPNNEFIHICGITLR